jgi:hypothetical protein
VRKRYIVFSRHPRRVRSHLRALSCSSPSKKHTTSSEGAIDASGSCYLVFAHIGYAEEHGVLNLAQQWNSAALHAIRDAKLGAPVVVRALAIVHTCMYEAWTAYDEGAVGTQLGGALYSPASEHTLADKERAISYAAYRALVDVQPVGTNSVYVPLIKQLGYDLSDSAHGAHGIMSSISIDYIVYCRTFGRTFAVVSDGR